MLLVFFKIVILRFIFQCKLLQAGYNRLINLLQDFLETVKFYHDCSQLQLFYSTKGWPLLQTAALCHIMGRISNISMLGATRSIR